MTNDVKASRDAFTFSLAGMRTVASFAAVPAIADDRINKILDARLRQLRSDHAAEEPQQWWHSHRRATQEEVCG